MTINEPLTDVKSEPPLAHMDALPSGTMLGEFELQGLLGVGGFGMVYRGYDHSLHRAVAIKEYMPSSLVGRAANLQVSARSTADAQPYLAGLASFMAEARLLAQFDHPSLVKVYRVWEENNTAYMVMPLYSGMTLKQARTLMSGPPPEDWLRALLWSVLEALKVLHANGTLHRDVSPDNIFLQDIGPPVLLDLGAARRVLIDSSQKHTAILKVNYAPIEQYADAHGLEEGPWTDLYALAAVTHGCLCNEAPLPATFRVVRDRLSPIAAVVKTVETHFGQAYSRSFVRAVDHALTIQPTKRTRDVETFAREMRLRTPKYMARFDWRARLGDTVSLDGVQDLGNPRAHMATRPHEQTDLTQPARAQRPTAELFLPDDSTLGSLTAVAWLRRRGVVVGAALVASLVLCVMYFAWLTHSARTTDLYSNSTPMLIEIEAQASALSVSAASAPVTASSPFAVLEPSAAVSPPKVEIAASGPVRVGPVPRKAASGAKSISSLAAGEQRQKPTAERRELCADSTVFGRSMCVYRECQKPEFAEWPQCVEDRKRWEKQDK